VRNEGEKTNGFTASDLLRLKRRELQLSQSWKGSRVQGREETSTRGNVVEKEVLMPFATSSTLYIIDSLKRKLGNEGGNTKKGCVAGARPFN